MTFDPKVHAKAVSEHGFSIANEVIPDDFRLEILQEISRLEANDAPMRANEFTGYKTLRWFDLLNRSEVWERVATFPAVTEVVAMVLGSDFLLSTMGTAVIDAGETAQRLHCDDALYGLSRPHRNLVCNTMWGLSEFTVENGATHLVPGSHRFDTYPDDHLSRKERPNVDPTGADQNYETIQAVMPIGSICFVVGTCYHGAGANVTDSRRSALTINYCAGSQRQQENLMLAHTREKLASFSPELQRMIGLHTSNFGVGHINAGDPRQILNV